MDKLKSILQSVALGVAVGLGTAVFLVYKLFTHHSELRRAEAFVREVPGRHKQEVIEALDAQRETTEETILALRDEVEKETKNEIINRFRKTFGVADNSGADAAAGEPAPSRTNED